MNSESLFSNNGLYRILHNSLTVAYQKHTELKSKKVKFELCQKNSNTVFISVFFAYKAKVQILKLEFFQIKGRVHCFSMQVVIYKWFLLNLKKKLAQIRLVVFEKNAKAHTLISKNDVTEPKARLL